LNFGNDWASSHVFISHLYIFGEMSVEVLASFLNYLFAVQL
jgi:hypothetical protein